MGYTKQNWVDVPDPSNVPAGAVEEKAASFNYMEQGISDAYDRADAAYALAQNAGTGGATSTLGNMGRVWLDSFTGSTDDAKLAAAMSAVGADTYPRAIQLTNRQYSFAAGNITPYEGFRLIGPEGYGNPERNSQTKTPGRVALSMAGPWLTAGTSTIYQVSLHGLSFTGGSGATVIGGSAGQFYCLSMRDIYSSGLKSVLGTQAQKLLLTAATFDGTWEINNCYSGAFHIGGSDNTLWPAGMLLDSGTSFASTGGANGQYHLWLDFCEKTYVGPLYVTAEGAWNGILVSGPAFNTTGNNQGGPINFFGMRLEGRNAGAPCNGAVFRQEGGIVRLRDSWIAYGMASPATPGHSPADAGLIHHAGGQLLVSGCTTDRASSVAETTPFVYTTGGGDCIVQATARAAKGGTWSQRPLVALANGGTDTRITDATVRTA